MRKSVIFLSILPLLSLAACIKDVAPDARMSVTTDKSEYLAGEPVTFRFEGTPDNIVFYSGEAGHEYANRHNYSRVGTFFMEFTSAARNGSAPASDIRLLVSLDYDGKYDAATIGNEENGWIDISGFCSWGPFGSSLDFQSSGELDINGILAEKGVTIAPDDTLHFAFRYQDERASKTQWIIRNTVLNLLSPFGTESSVANIRTFGWTPVPEKGNTVTTSQLLMRGDDTLTELWIVSDGFSGGGVEADSGTPLKSISTDLEEYTYTYSEPGTYTATFETSSVWYTGGNGHVTEITVTVLPAEGQEDDAEEAAGTLPADI